MGNNIEAANGFISKWLICGPRCEDIGLDLAGIAQDDFDDRVRAILPNDICSVPDTVHFGKTYSGETWRYRYTGNNIFVDLSSFYFHLCRVNFYGFTQIEAEKSAEMTLCLWCYPATDVWVNGEKVISHEIPVYKPMRRVVADVQLNQGINTIFVRCQNLGVRDTRNIFGLQLQGELSGLKNTLPDTDGRVTQLIRADEWLDNVRAAGTQLLAPSEPPAECSVYLEYETYDKTVSWKDGSALDIGEGCQIIRLSLTVQGESLKRDLELIENDLPVYRTTKDSIPEHRKRVIAELVDLGRQYSPKDEKGLYAYGVYARMVAGGGKISAEDKKILMHSLAVVESCSDCADFALSVLLRILLTFPIEDEELLQRMKQVVLGFRYWPDEPGSDAMCFDSENHMLLFHGCQLAAGLMYPDEIFTRSGRTGREMNRLGNERSIKWLDQVLSCGFEEFLSEVYMCLTTAALLVLVDFGNEEVKEKATTVTDRLLEQLAHHAFHGNAIGPMGRAYRDVINPQRQGMQSLLHYIKPTTPRRRTYFLSTFATSTYKVPENLPRMMDEPVSMVYRSGSAEINLEKTEDYLLSSVNCPAVKNGGIGSSHSVFSPGAFGYQQHLWYAALDVNCVAFINHPGITKDKCDMRPGYWYGNGIMPALKQEGHILGGIYYLNKQTHPIYFTHLFWPSFALDESVTEPHWYFGRKGSGYMAIWSSVEGVPFDDVLTGCEYRFPAEHSAFLCVMGSAAEDGGFREFMQRAKATSPVLSADGRTLHTDGGYSLEYVPVP